MLCQSLLFAAVLICIPPCRVLWSGSLTATKRSIQCTNLNVPRRHRKKNQRFPAQGNNPISTGQQSYKHRNSTYRKKQTKPNPCTFFPSARTCEKATHACTTYNHTRLVVVGVLLVAANTSDFHYFDASYTITRLTRILHSSRTVHAQLWEAPKVTKHG